MEGYDARKVSRFNLKVIFVISLLVTIQAFITTGTKFGLPTAIGTGLICAIGVGIYHMNPHLYVEGVVVSILPVILGVTMSAAFGGMPKLFAMYLVSMCLAALYFNKKVLIYFTILLFTILVTTFSISPVSLMSPRYATIGDFGDRMVQLIAGFIILYNLMKWGNEALNKAEETVESQEKLITNILGLIEGLSSYSDEIAEVNQKINYTFDFIKEVEDGNERIAVSTDEIAVSIEEIAKGTEELAIKSENISELGEETFSLFQKADDKIDSGTELVNEAVGVMEELKNSVAKVDKISENIMQIADETNLLSLDGAIGAVNGDGVSGFGTVADDIRDLSEESRELAEEVKEIVTEVKGVTAKATKIMIPTEEVDYSIADIFAEIQNISDELLVNMSKVTDATEDQVASTEEISASVEEISDASDEVSIQAKEMYDDSQELKDIMNQVVQSNQKLNDSFESKAEESKEKLEEVDVEF